MNRKLKKTLRAFLAFCAGILYSGVLYWIGAAFVGVGHGPEWPFELLTAPQGLGLLLWPVLFALITFSDHRIVRNLALLLLVAYIVGFLNILSGVWFRLVHFDNGSFEWILRALLAFHLILIVLLGCFLIRKMRPSMPERV